MRRSAVFVRQKLNFIRAVFIYSSASIMESLNTQTRWPRLRWAWLIFVVSASAQAAAPVKPAAARPVDFNRDIRPILSDNCYACHGPDEKQRKAKLRFDVKEDALKPAKSGEFAIVPGDAAKSHLLARINSTDADKVMPPKTGKKLNDAQKDSLKRWIEQGAKFEGHWAFIKPERPAPPKTSLSSKREPRSLGDVGTVTSTRPR